MKIFDFECSETGCDRRFEVFTDSDDEEQKCPDCGAPAVKLLGGKPALSVGQERTFDRNYRSTQYDQQVERKGYCLPLGEKETDPHLHVHVDIIKGSKPKAKA